MIGSTCLLKFLYIEKPCTNMSKLYHQVFELNNTYAVIIRIVNVELVINVFYEIYKVWILGDIHDAQSSCQMEPLGLLGL